MALGKNVKKRREQLELTQAELAKLVGVSQVAIANLERRDSGSSRNISALANALQVTVYELENGFDSNVLPAVQKKADVPVISWVQAGEWNEAIDLFAAGYADEYIARINGGLNVYALRVRGHSMTAPSGVHPSFPEGYIIHVDPEQSAKHNDYVIAKVVGDNAVTFKQYKEDEKPYLFPLNPDYKPIFEEFIVLGRVIGSSMKL